MIEGIDLSGRRLEDDVPHSPVVAIARSPGLVLPKRLAQKEEQEAHVAYLDGLESQNKTPPVARRKTM